MYLELIQEGKTHVCLWCDGPSEDGENPRKRKRDSSPGSMSKCAEKERDTEDLVTELKELHREKCNLTISAVDQNDC